MPTYSKRDLQPPRHPPPDVVDAIIGRDEDDSDGGPMRASGTEDSPMRASGSAAALRAMGEQIDDAVELDEMERLTRALDPPRAPEQPRHERPLLREKAVQALPRDVLVAVQGLQREEGLHGVRTAQPIAAVPLELGQGGQRLPVRLRQLGLSVRVVVASELL